MTNEELQQMFAETARIRELANPAAVPYSDFQVPASNVAPSSFASNLGGLLFGGADSGLNEYLSREQQKQMQSQALMSAAMSLLKNSGYTTRPIGLGEALGSAYEAGTAGYQGAQKNAIEQMLTKQKLDEYKRQVADEEAYRNMFTQMPTAGAPMTPIQALSVGGGQAGPTPQRAAMIGQPTPAGVSAAGGMPALTQVQMDILRRMPAKEGRAELLKLMQPPAPSEKTKLLNELGLKPTLENLRLLDKPEADPEKIQYLKALNMPITLDNLRQLDKPEALPTEVRLLEAAKMPITMENIMAIRRSSASQTTNILNAEKKGLELAYEQGVKDLGASRDMARSANATLANIDRILPALDTAITGPAADFRATLLRVGKQLNVAGADADQVLRNTATVVQGLAQQELAAAEQMRGQGALTDAERAILRRAAGGDVSLTAGELRVGLLAAQRSARARAESHGQLLSTAVRTIPSLAQIAPMYEVPVYGAPAANPLQNAVQQEIDRRKASGGKR